MTPFSTAIRPFLSYCTIGFFNTTLSFVLMFLGAQLGLHYTVYSAIGYFISFIFSYFMNSYFTFHQQAFLLKRLVLFFLCNSLILLFVELFQYYLIEYFQLEHYFALFLGLCTFTLLGFPINRYIVYRS